VSFYLFFFRSLSWRGEEEEGEKEEDRKLDADSLLASFFLSQSLSSDSAALAFTLSCNFVAPTVFYRYVFYDLAF